MPKRLFISKKYFNFAAELNKTHLKYEIDVIFPLLLFLLCKALRSGKLRIDFNLGQKHSTKEGEYTYSRFICYEAGFFVIG